MKPTILITGSALATSLGADRETTWQAVLAGRCGFGPMTAMESPLPAGKDGAQAIELPADFSPDLPREARYLKWTLAAALADAGLSGAMPYERSRCSILLGTTLHGMRAGGQFLRTGDYSHLQNFSAGATIALAAKGLPFDGAGLTTCSACSSSLGAIALAVTLLQSGQFDCVIAGGYDTISEYVYGGFNSLRLVADGPLRPFSKNRAGMKLAEGYGIVVLERADDFARRIREERGDNSKDPEPSGRATGATGKASAGGSATGHFSTRNVSPLTPALSPPGRGSQRRAHAQILGWGESADAHHLTQPHPQGDGAARAMAAALDRAQIAPAGIDLIAAHATGTPDNDAGEFAALTRLFGDDLPRVPVVGFKSHLGHTLGGAGAVELILSSLALRDQIVPACANITAEDLEFPSLNVSVGSAKPASIRATLNTSLGFGGANTCVVLSLPLPGGERAGVRSETSRDENVSAAEVRESSANRPPLEASAVSPLINSLLRGQGQSRTTGREVFITGLGVIAPGVLGRDGLLDRLQHPQPTAALTLPIGDAALEGLLNARRIRRMSDYVKFQLAAATLAMRDAGLGDIGDLAEQFSSILGTAHGSATYSYNYYEQIVREGVLGANPMLFAEGVPNAGAAHISLMLGLKGACQSVIGTRTAGLDALALAAARIAAGDWDRAIVGAGEEESDVVRRAYQHCGMAASGESASAAMGAAAGAFTGRNGFVCSGGAAAIVLESRSAFEARGGRPIARVTGSSFARSDCANLPAAAERVLLELGSPAHVLSSAAGTWLDDIEASAIRAVGSRGASSIYGHIAETFSASPLIGIAAVIAGKALPRLLSHPSGLGDTKPADGSESIDTFAAICTDPTGLVSGVSISIL